MRILVTGGAGYVGSHAVKWLSSHGHEVWVYDNLSMGHREAVPAKRLIVGDLHDVGLLDHTLIAQRIEAVVHFAALAFVGESVRNPALYYRNNVTGTLALMERMRAAGVSRIVFSSTCATYGVPEIVPIAETTPQRPINPYGRTKLVIEHALADYAAAYGWACVALRYFNAAGAASDGSIGEDHNPETHLLPLLLQVALGQRPHLDLFGTDYPTPDGTCVRDYVHVDDLAAAHARALERATPGELTAFNLGTGRGYSIREAHALAEQITGKTIPLCAGPRRPGDPPSLIASAELARTVLGWQPYYRELGPILETAWNWHRRHPRGFGG